MVVSVIVTVFNKECVVKRAIESIINQTYKDLQVILVDDGSSDDSGIICDEFAIKDNRVLVIHQDNEGQVRARKRGLEEVSGQYVFFLDADDWIENDTIHQLLNIALKHEADVVTFGWIIHDSEKITLEADTVPEGEYKTQEEKKELSGYVFFKDLGERSMNDSLNTKMFRKELIEKHLMSFNDTIVYAEDTFVAFACIINAKCVVTTQKCFYHYMTQDSTINNKKNLFVIRDLVEGYAYAESYLPQNELVNIYKKQLERIFLHYLFLSMNKFMEFTEEHNFIRYFLPDGSIPINSRIALYGAGVVGTSFYRQLKKDYQICYIIDKCADEISVENVAMVFPKDANQDDVDYLILAIKDKEIALNMKDVLINEYGWSEEKLIWEKPIPMLEKIISEF